MATLTLPQDLYSPDQLSALVLELHTLRSAAQDAAARAKTGSKKSVSPPEPSPLLAEIIQTTGTNSLDTASLEALHTQLETLLTKAPIAHITLAGIPNTVIKRSLTDWFRSHIGPEVLLTFTVRGDICGGAVLQVGSHVYDFSFRRQLIANKQKIGEIAGRVR